MKGLETKNYFFAVAGLLLAAVLLIPSAAPAADIPLGDAANYAILYTGTGGHNLQITNVTVNGNIGVGGTGKLQDNGPNTINGYVNFSAANTGQFSNNNGGNVGPTSVNYSVGQVTTDLNNLSTLSGDYSGGTSITIGNSGATINESAGALQTVGGVVTRVFNVTSYSAVNTTVVTINGDGSGDPVVFNFAPGTGNVNLSGTVVLTGAGLTSGDQVLWNFQSTGQNVGLNNNGEIAFQGILLAPNDVMNLTHAELDGRVFGGDSGDMQIVSGDVLDTPVTNTPIPPSALLLGSGLLGLGLLGWRRKPY